ncbi:hypothetical protein CUJ88_47245 (plasmid) [Paraburkholderia hospita]|uniref:Uncharacterized protein n=1 Tax=Paraburkholderia hospita TaxID=169430 RepID=A0AAN1JM47_9BURK|nr:hypothetical protein C2L64_51220 [Paraburkholderia hospita]AXF05964.1 hypothetical protein CUJ88_47245 [Paraburkholderia hospita]
MPSARCKLLAMPKALSACGIGRVRLDDEVIESALPRSPVFQLASSVAQCAFRFQLSLRDVEE